MDGHYRVAVLGARVFGFDPALMQEVERGTPFWDTPAAQWPDGAVVYSNAPARPASEPPP